MPGYLLLHCAVLVQHHHGHLGILLVPHHFVSDLERLLDVGGLGDLRRGGAGGGLVSSIIPHDVSHDLVLVLPQLAVSDLEQLLLAVGDLPDLGHGGDVGGLLGNLCPLLNGRYFCRSFFSSFKVGPNVRTFNPTVSPLVRTGDTTTPTVLSGTGVSRTMGSVHRFQVKACVDQ